MTHNKWVFNRRLNCPRLPDCLRSVGKEFHGRRRWSVYVGRRTSLSQTNGVDADGRQASCLWSVNSPEWQQYTITVKRFVHVKLTETKHFISALFQLTCDILNETEIKH